MIVYIVGNLLCSYLPPTIHVHVARAISDLFSLALGAYGPRALVNKSDIALARV